MFVVKKYYYYTEQQAHLYTKLLPYSFIPCNIHTHLEPIIFIDRSVKFLDQLTLLCFLHRKIVCVFLSIIVHILYIR